MSPTISLVLAFDTADLEGIISVNIMHLNNIRLRRYENVTSNTYGLKHTHCLRTKIQNFKFSLD